MGSLTGAAPRPTGEGQLTTHRVELVLQLGYRQRPSLPRRDPKRVFQCGDEKRGCSIFLDHLAQLGRIEHSTYQLVGQQPGQFCDCMHPARYIVVGT